jgi:hypothetical protein
VDASNLAIAFAIFFFGSTPLPVKEVPCMASAARNPNN